MCPTAPERYNGYFDTDGCPDNVPVNSLSDADFDGLIDSVDLCKYDKEVYNNFEDTDGCPDTIPGDYSAISPKYQSIDNDVDGVDDRWDQCLNERENYNGFLDFDGCLMYLVQNLP